MLNPSDMIHRIENPDGLALYIVWLPTAWDMEGPRTFTSRVAAEIFLGLMLNVVEEELFGEVMPQLLRAAYA